MLLYSILSAIALVLYFPFIVFKKGPWDRVSFIKERLGISHYEKTDIWVHAVSVGEVIASVPFLKALKREFPDKRITLSTTTYTGQNVARERFSEADRIMYMPWDSGPTAARSVSSMRPEIFITVETELWPMLFRLLKRHKSRIIILNGRISNRSYTGYKRLRLFMKQVLSYPDFFFMQGETDAERIISIGADSNKVGVMGNFKFDISFDTQVRPEWLDSISGKILLAASTHKGEEEIILDAFSPLSKHYPELKLIIAPRHPERFAEVEEIIKKRNLTYIRRTKISQESIVRGREGLNKERIILLDTIGELSRTFSAVTIAFIGGSLVPVGGHNILEPAYWGKPVLFGPHMDNFPFASDFLEQAAAVEVKNADDIVLKITDLLDNNDKAAQMGQAAKALVEKNSGAVQKAIHLVRGFIGTA